MPSYDFECPRCHHRFEEFLTISERDRKDIPCPACGAVGARRGVSAGYVGRGSPAAGGAAPVPT